MHCLVVLAGMLKCLLIIVLGYQEGSASGVRRQVRWCERVGKSVGRGHWAGNKRWCQGVWESQVQHTECTHPRLLSASRMSSPFPLHLYSYWVSRTTCCYSTLHLANPCFVYTRQHRPIMHMHIMTNLHAACNRNTYGKNYVEPEPQESLFALMWEASNLSFSNDDLLCCTQM